MRELRGISVLFYQFYSSKTSFKCLVAQLAPPSVSNWDILHGSNFLTPNYQCTHTKKGEFFYWLENVFTTTSTGMWVHVFIVFVLLLPLQGTKCRSIRSRIELACYQKKKKKKRAWNLSISGHNCLLHDLDILWNRKCWNKSPSMCESN